MRSLKTAPGRGHCRGPCKHLLKERTKEGKDEGVQVHCHPSCGLRAGVCLAG